MTTLNISAALQAALASAESCEWAVAIDSLEQAQKMCSRLGIAGANANNIAGRSGGKLVCLRQDAVVAGYISAVIPWVKQYLQEYRSTPSPIARVLIGTAIANQIPSFNTDV